MLTTIVSGIIVLALAWWFLKRFFWWILGFIGVLFAISVLIEFLKSPPKKKEVKTDRSFDELKELLDHPPEPLHPERDPFDEWYEQTLSEFGPDTYDYLDEDNRLSLYYADNLDGHAFEEWCAELLLDNGFYDVAVTPGSGDQGVDVLAVKGGVKYAIQCKCYSHDLGNTPVQEVHAGKSLYGCHVGVVMTNRHFTSGAKQLADATGVLLWDREALQEMIEIAQQVIEV